MTHFGSYEINGVNYHFDKGQILELPGNVPEEIGEEVKEEKKAVTRGRKPAETASVETNAETR